jgi:endogenous inhibitor of DNA gyrase (YacG/DUF329 family)
MSPVNPHELLYGRRESGSVTNDTARKIMNNQQTQSEQPDEKPAGHSHIATSGPATIKMSLFLVVECPHCGMDHNLASSEFDDGCQFTSIVFSDGYDWRDGMRGMELGCPDCGKTFQLGDIEY